MSLILDTAKDAIAPGMESGDDPSEQTLTVVIVRLLTVALKLSESGHPQQRTLQWLLPTRYHAWPMVVSDLASSHGNSRLRFYVSPKAATVSDDEPFPVGSVFVVESCEMAGGTEVPLWRFVMGKYAGVSSGRSDAKCYEVWAYTTYGPNGGVLGAGDSSCGICRLPLTGSAEHFTGSVREKGKRDGRA
jgi:hypothetical protein